MLVGLFIFISVSQQLHDWCQSVFIFTADKDNIKK